MVDAERRDAAADRRADSATDALFPRSPERREPIPDRREYDAYGRCDDVFLAECGLEDYARGLDREDARDTVRACRRCGGSGLESIRGSLRACPACEGMGP